MGQVAWHGGVPVDSAHLDEVVAQDWPHSDEVGVLHGGLFEGDVSFGDCGCIVHGLVNLHFHEEDAGFSFEIKFQVIFFERSIFAANRQHLESVSSLGLRDNISTFDILIVDVLVVLATLVVPSEDVDGDFFATISPIESQLQLGVLGSLKVVGPVADNLVLDWLEFELDLVLHDRVVRVALVLNSVDLNLLWHLFVK